MGCLRKPIEGFDGYEIDTDGVVWTAWQRIGGKGGVHKWRCSTVLVPMKPQLKKTGYLQIGIRRTIDRKKVYFLVHRLVAKTFVENPHNHPIVCHNDNNKLNNTPSNLRWDTNKGNTADMMKAGTIKFGEKHPCAKLTEISVMWIKKQLAQGVSCRPIATKYNVTFQAIDSIKRGRGWKHVTI